MVWGWIEDKVSDAADLVAETASSAAGAVRDAAGDAVDVVGNVASNTGWAIGQAGRVANTATFGAAGEVMELVDDTVLDGIDEVTGGLVDIDFDDGNLSANVGIDGIAAAGVRVGEDGLGKRMDMLGNGYDVHVDDGGLHASGEAGIDFGPLPYAEGHLDIGADGDVDFEGRAQGTMATPWGVVSGRGEAAFVRTDDMWAGRIDAEGTLTTANGTRFGAGVDLTYAETADGSVLDVRVDGSVAMPGVGSVGGGVGYQRAEQDGVVIEGFEADVHAEGYGHRIDAGVDYVGIETPEGSAGAWNTDIDARGAVFDAIGVGTGDHVPSPAAPPTPNPTPIPSGPLAGVGASGSAATSRPSSSPPRPDASPATQPTELPDATTPTPTPTPARQPFHEPEVADDAFGEDPLGEAFAQADHVEHEVMDDLFNDLGPTHGTDLG